MILFLEDWKKYPNAIIDIKTTNRSWVRLAGLLKSMGIKNHAFLLALHNPNLQGIDPFRNDLTQEQVTAITIEARRNPWYFFRELVKLKGDMRLEANRLNIAMWWMFFNHITTLCIACRQIGKSTAVWVLDTYILGLAGDHTELHLLTKDDSLRVKSIRDIKAILEGLPWYLNLKNRADTYNTEQITIGALSNVYHTSVARSSEVDAGSIGRGLTVACHRIDEFAFIKNIEVTLSSLLPTATKARQTAAEKGGLYGNIFTTTAGYLNTREGEYAYKIYNECLKWRETLFDAENNENLTELVKKNSPGRSMNVLIEMNHRQLGKTDEWLRENIKIAMVEGERAEAEFLNVWSRGNASSPISKEMLEVIHNSVIKDPYTTVSKQGFIINWYLPLQEANNRPLVMGLDTSDAIGTDDIAMCLRDAYTGEIVACGLFNETNILTFSEFLLDLLEERPNILLTVIERKSTGSSIIDNLLKLMPMRGMDPFRKLFNWVVNDAQEKKEYMVDVLNKTLSSRNPEMYIKYKKEFGYATSATGRSSRDNLYGTVFTSAIKYTGKYTRDEVLARQLAGLVRKNGRIDHRAGEHDDLCFTGDMLVKTIKGNIPIKKLKLGDLVLTRDGYKPIIALFKRKAETITKFGITGTPDHPFITPKGIVKFKNIKEKDEVFIWQNEKLLSIMAKDIIDIQNQTEDICEYTTGGTINGKTLLSRYTDKYGSITTEKYQKDIRSITKTKILSTTISTTSNVCQQENILENTLCLKSNEKKLENEVNGMINLVNGGEKIQKKQRSFTNRMEQNPHRLNDGEKKTLKDLKRCVLKVEKKRQYLEDKLQGSNKREVENCSNGIEITQNYQNLQKQNLQLPQRKKPKYERKKKKKTVYNITVADCHEYFVNNVLVHNCVASMLSMFPLLQGRNLHYYGLNTKLVLSAIANETIEEEGGIENVIEKENQSVLMNQVYQLLDQIKAESNPILTNVLVNKVKHISAAIEDKHKINFNLDAILEEIKLKKRKYYTT